MRLFHFLINGGRLKKKKTNPLERDAWLQRQVKKALTQKYNRAGEAAIGCGSSDPGPRALVLETAEEGVPRGEYGPRVWPGFSLGSHPGWWTQSRGGLYSVWDGESMASYMLLSIVGQ